MDQKIVDLQVVLDKFLMSFAATVARATEMPSRTVTTETSSPARKDFLTIPEIAQRWRIARPTVYNRLRDADVKVLDFGSKSGRGRKVVAMGEILKIEAKLVKRL